MALKEYNKSEAVWKDIADLQIPGTDGVRCQAPSANICVDGVWTEVWSAATYIMKNGVVNTDFLSNDTLSEIGNYEESKYTGGAGECTSKKLSNIICNYPEYNDSWGKYTIAKHLYTPKTFIVPNDVTTLIIEGIGTNTASSNNGSRFYVNTDYNGYGSVASQYITTNGEFEVSINVSKFVGKSIYLIVMPYVMASSSSLTMTINVRNIYFI